MAKEVLANARAILESLHLGNGMSEAAPVHFLATFLLVLTFVNTDIADGFDVFSRLPNWN